MKHLCKEITMYIMVFIMVLLVCPMIVFAKTSAFSGGSGCASDPYQISTASGLAAISSNLSAHYQLTNNIDLGNYGAWLPIGHTNSFTGTFDGNGYSITGMTVYTTDKCVPGECMGLFSSLENATVKNIGSISGSIVYSGADSKNIGGICGYAEKSAISNCTSNIKIIYQSGDITGDCYMSTYQRINAGGIVGYASNCSISSCGNTGVISSVASNADTNIGGICGWYNDTSIVNCFNTGKLKGETGYATCNVGGIAGSYFAVSKQNSIAQSYNAGTLISIGGKNGYVGGIQGSIPSRSDTNITGCYYLSGIEPVGNIEKVKEWQVKRNNKIVIETTPLSMSDLKNTASFVEFDFGTAWAMEDGEYPYPISNNGDKDSSTESNSQTGAMCEKHTYTSDNGNFCIVCNYEYIPTFTPVKGNVFMYALEDNTPIRDNYYSRNSNIVRTISKNQHVLVKATLVNAVNRTWYLLSDGTYIFSENVTSQKPTRYTLTFDANGGSGVPSSIQSATFWNIPSDVPTRSGYVFLGYSNNKNATKAQYDIGNTIRVDSSNVTLYAIWEEKHGSLYDLSATMIADLNNSPGVSQENNTCTLAAVTVMLARKQIVDEKSSTFTISDVISSNRGESGFIYWTTTFRSNGDSYALKREKPPTVAERTNRIVELLDQHREGIMIFFEYTKSNGTRSQHAIILSDYEITEDGEYQFYVYDSASSKRLGRKKLEDSWSYTNLLNVDKNTGSYEDVFQSIKSDLEGIVYIK